MTKKPPKKQYRGKEQLPEIQPSEKKQRYYAFGFLVGDY